MSAIYTPSSCCHQRNSHISSRIWHLLLTNSRMRQEERDLGGVLVLPPTKLTHFLTNFAFSTHELTYVSGGAPSRRRLYAATN